MKKVLFVINTLGCAGAEKALIELLKHFNPKQYDVSLYVLLDQGELIHDVPYYVHILNEKYVDQSVLSQQGKNTLIKHIFARLFNRKVVFKNFGYTVTNFFRMVLSRNLHIDKLLWKTISDSGMENKNEYDLAIAYLEGGSTYYVHNHIHAKNKATFLHVDYSKAGYNRILDRNCYLSFNSIFCVSDEVKASLLRVYPEVADKVHIFHNILDVNEIHTKAKLPGGFQDSYTGKRILTVGRLTSQKAYDVAIRAMRIIKDKHLDAKWYVVGEGDLRKKLEKLIESLNLQDSFILLGAKSNPYPYYRECDLYVHATRFEGKSIAIQEAQILGKPILVSDCSGNREQVHEAVDGYFCDLTPESIANQILFLLNHPNIMKEIGENAKRKYVQQEILIHDIFGV